MVKSFRFLYIPEDCCPDLSRVDFFPSVGSAWYQSPFSSWYQPSAISLLIKLRWNRLGKLLCRFYLNYIRLHLQRAVIFFYVIPVLVIPFSCSFVLKPIKLVIPLSCSFILIPAFVVIIRSETFFCFKK